MTESFLSIDPGAQASGYALFTRGVLRAAGLLRAPGVVKSLEGRVHYQRLALAEVVQGHRLFADVPVIGELMVVRPRKRGEVFKDPNDLITLATIAGALCTSWVRPEDWKGAKPRPVEQAHSKAALRPEELALVEAVLPASLRKEAWSAVGIGLSVCGRAHKRCGMSKGV